VGVAEACDVLGVPRSHYYRSRARIAAGADVAEAPSRSRRPSPRALRQQERAEVLTLLRSERFVDLAPREVYVTLLDEGVYLCS